ncbi:dynein heavy chain 9, axonemal-like [Piliocolobus tephrosceles]|uniref:dynein heavy chain 9, axonemal-like n=1 Tax=Piliocolobus tephrosceles TaxID=591936 RepID=UPI00130190A0|nr:dynein heavy chain 9, axonemal-like [Piliocolobus tephrosceles]
MSLGIMEEEDLAEYFRLQYGERLLQMLQFLGLWLQAKEMQCHFSTLQILLRNREVNAAELDFLLRSPVQTGTASPVEFLSHQAWGAVKVLSSMEEFCNLDRDIEGSAKSWKKFVESECPEKEKLPQEWKNKTALQRLCVMRAMRPDRMTYAMRDFVEEKLGSKYVVGRALDFATSFEESGPAMPMFFILSPGVDPLKDVESQGRKLGYTFNNQNFHNVSLGQGQEVVAEAALDLAAKKGHWVILQNIHLVAKWLSTLEKKLEEHSENSHPEFRVFMSAEPAPSPESHIIPQGILENSIKITNEPPTGMHANLHKALDNFTQDTLEMCSRETEFKSILFALCYFHAVVAERRKFGPQGWNRSYPFNTGDLTISMNVLYNFLEANAKVPYDDLRYLFGEIMYGGHITDDWDRRLCRTYLEEFIRPEMLEGELSLAPGFPLPGNMDYNGYHQYIDAELPPESPYLYGLHPNAEIGFLTQTSEKLFRTVLELQPRDSQAGDGAGATREEKEEAPIVDYGVRNDRSQAERQLEYDVTLRGYLKSFLSSPPPAGPPLLTLLLSPLANAPALSCTPPAQLKLWNKYRISNIPSLIFLDATTGKVVCRNGLLVIRDDPEGLEFPWGPKPFREVIAGPLLRNNGQSLESSSLEGSHVGVYFSAHWCPPCRSLTRVLVESYRKIKEAGQSFEIIFVSADRSVVP